MARVRFHSAALLISFAGAVFVSKSLFEADLQGNAIERVEAARCSNNPLITRHSSETLGQNINGPSVIRVPSWIKNPLGKYYLYFANHSGKYIRLAFADSLCGPWTVHEPGTLRLVDAGAFREHIASPDVHVDNAHREIRMYFHGLTKERPEQWTGVATSPDGLHFRASEEVLGKFYFRVWQWGEAWYALAKNWNSGWGELYRSETGLADFESGGDFLRSVRHSAVLVRDHQLLIFHSRVGDAPERILVSSVDMRPDWREWKASEPIEVLRPEASYEGVEYPVKESVYGSAIKVQQLRDPYIHEEGSQTYLLYSAAGEMNISAAELTIEMKSARQ